MSTLPYAILEVRELLRRASPITDDRDPIVRYLCALFAELAYHHVPQWEIDDDRKRAKVIPCRAYQTLVARSFRTDVQNILQQAELGQGFVAEDRGVIAVGLAVDDLLFIGFRGTRFLYDWRINLKSNLVHADVTSRYQPLGGRFHSGFSEEALRISAKITEIFDARGIGDARRVFLSGHSLGGAVAALAGNSLPTPAMSVCIFGAPRYSNLASYAALASRPPTHVRRIGDVVPTIPPKWLGYVDHPYELGTDGHPYVNTSRSRLMSDSWRWASFLGQRFRPHLMETYRGELGIAANASGAHVRLTDFSRL